MLVSFADWLEGFCKPNTILNCGLIRPPETDIFFTVKIIDFANLK